MSTTYIIAGYDGTGGFNEPMKVWDQREFDSRMHPAPGKDDVVVMRPRPGETFEQTLSHIKGPANIVIESHGSNNGYMQWGNGDFHTYGELFAALPRTGIQSITVSGCYGEAAQSMLDQAPHGAIVQSVGGSKTTMDGRISGLVATDAAAEKNLNPLTIMLSALDHNDPKRYQEETESQNRWVRDNPEEAKAQEIGYEDANPNNVLPHTIGIGGKPPTNIDLNVEMARISAQGRTGKLDPHAMAAAVAAVKEHWKDDAPPKEEGLGDRIRGWFSNEPPQSQETGKSPAAVDAVARKLASGADTNQFTLEEKRIGYAITVADMYKDGSIARAVERGTKGPAPTTWDGKGDETLAKIQTVFERVYGLTMDAQDNHVSGKITAETAATFAQNHITGMDTKAAEKAYLQQLLQSPDVKAMFGTVKDAHGVETANVPLQVTRAQGQQR